MALGSQQRGGGGRLALGLAIALAVLTFSTNRTGPVEDGPVRAGTEDVAAPVLSWLSMPFRGVETALENRRAKAQAFEENVTLKDELRRLQDIERQKIDLERKLAAVRHHMFLPPIDEHRIVIARAVVETGGPFASTALVNAGLDQGVREGSAVMSTQGLYGHILRVGDRSSRVLRLSDPSSRVSVKSDRSDARAILSGSNTGRPVLRFVAKPDDFVEGDPVLTSGDEGILPEGLIIGFAEADGSVRLSEDGRTADWIRIYVREPIDPPAPVEQGVVLRVVEKPVVVAPDLPPAAVPEDG